LYVPGAHTSQLDWRDRENLATGQEVQVTTSPSLYFPASHAVQAVAAVALLVWSPAPHIKHSFSWAVGAYLPSSHFSQDAAFKLYSPA
jgi:hypothetical protein